MIRLLIRSSLRILSRQRTLSIVKISGLAVGLATFLITTLYCIHEWSFDKQHPGWERIYRYVHRVKSDNDLQSFAFTSATTGPALETRFSEVEDFTRLFQIEVSLKRTDSDAGFVERKFAFADANFLQFFTFPVRDYQDPEILSKPGDLILTPGSARKYFGHQDPVGRTILLNGAIELTVKGVFARDFSSSHLNFDFVASFATLEQIKNHAVVSKQIPASLNLDHKGFNAFYTYLRLASVEAGKTLEEKLPSFIEEFRGEGRSQRLKPVLQSLSSIHLDSDMLYEVGKNGSRSVVAIYFLVGILILATAIINYVNITTAEFFIRARNVGLKKILGIDRGTLLKGYLIESMVVCGIAITAGAMVTALALPYFNTIMQTRLTFFSAETIRILLVAYPLTVLLSGFLPAVQTLRQDPLIAFHGNLTTNMPYVRNALVFLQLTVSFVLLALALLIIRQTNHLLEKDTGFDAAQVMVINAAGMQELERISFKDRLMSHRLVSSASMCSTPPGGSLFTFGLTLPGGDGDEDRRLTFHHMFVDENFLETMGVGLHEGRFFDPGFSADSLSSFVVNETGAKAIEKSVIGYSLEVPNIYTGQPSMKSIVGIVKDFHFASFHTAIDNLMLEYNPRLTRYVLLRFHPENTRDVIGVLRRVWKDNAPQLPLHYYFLDDSFAEHYVAEQRSKRIVTVLSLIAIGLAALGIFGSSLFVLQQRTKEIGVRKLLGSAPHGLFFLMFRPILTLLIVSCSAGVPIAAWLGNQWLETYPYRTNVSLGILIMSFGVIGIVMLFTVSFYFRKIMRVHPAEVLRSN